MEKEILGIECKFVHHIPADIDKNREDVHIVKECIHYKDGTYENDVKLIYNFKRPFWVTKENYRNHKQKKESEDIKRVTEYTSTQSQLPRECCKRLGIINKNPTLRDVTSSPYLYGVDVDSRVFLKHKYKETYGELYTPYSVCVLDTEVDTENNELLIISVAMKGKVFTAILKRLIERYSNPIKELQHLYDKYIPKTELNQDTVVEYKIYDSEIELITEAFKKVHEWKPDFLTMWNMAYDIDVILNICNKYGVEPEDIFSDPKYDKSLRYFKYKEDKTTKVTASGVNKPPGAHERWHILTSSASFYVIDAMCTFNYVRVGGKAIPGGYSLDNVLKEVLGSNLKKLKFEDDEGMNKLVGIDWHKYMVLNKPLHYIIYNIWDVLSVLELDDKTNDLSTSLPILSGDSSFDNFKSGPKKIIDSILFFYLKHNRVLGCRPPVTEDSEIDLSDWIVMLPTHRSVDNGLKSLLETDMIHTNTKSHVMDCDAVSSYPSNTMAMNVSYETMSKEILEIENVKPMVAKLQNINLIFGPINSTEYCSTMFKFPKLYELYSTIENKDIPDLNNNIPFESKNEEIDVEPEENDL